MRDIQQDVREFMAAFHQVMPDKPHLRFTKPSHRTVSLGTTGTAKILTEKTIQRYLKAQGAAR